MCGEHQSIGSPPPGLAGSSPRVRGTRSFDDPVHRQRGIIPACAGNTGSSLVRWVRSSGSSPRVRGTLPRPVHRADHEGIIPACAGNTIWLRPSRRGSGDHPRVCGEHFHDPYTGRTMRGSSPRVRGTPFGCVLLAVGAGIIPACAGNTPAKAASPSRNRDHPRVCGEHSVTASGHACMRGSSPRVRGTRRMS